MTKKVEDKILELRNNGVATRAQIAELLRLIGKPGKKREEKVAAVRELNLENRQQYRVEDDLEGYPDF